MCDEGCLRVNTGFLATSEQDGVDGFSRTAESSADIPPVSETVGMQAGEGGVSQETSFTQCDILCELEERERDKSLAMY